LRPCAFALSSYGCKKTRAVRSICTGIPQGTTSLEKDMSCNKYLLTLVLAALGGVTAFAQGVPSAEKELEQKALAMLNEMIEDARSFRAPENRVRILLISADLLWRYDEKRARALLTEVMNIVSEHVRHSGEAEPVSGNPAPGLLQMRSEIAQLLAARDPQFAHDFLLATRPSPELRGYGYSAEYETSIEATLAQAIGKKDPGRALHMAEEMLAAGKPPQLVSGILYTLVEKDLSAAQKLAASLTARLLAEGRLSQESAHFALSLAAMAPVSDEDVARASQEKSKSLLSRAEARGLIDKAIRTAQLESAAAKSQNDPNARSNAVNLLGILKSMMPMIEKSAPSSVAALKRSLADVEQLMDPQQRMWEDLNVLAGKGSVDMLLEAAPKVSVQMRNAYYQRAAQVARDQGNVERARQIINDSIPNEWERRQALMQIEQYLLQKSISEGRFDEARRLLTRFSKEERVNAITQMANMAQSGNKELAAQLLEEAWTLVAGAVESRRQLNSQFQVAQAFVSVKPERSFEIIEATIDKYNELFGATCLVEGFEERGSFREQEMILYNGNSATSYLYQYSACLAELARVDLERVRSVVARFSRNEARASILLVILPRLLREPDGPGDRFGGVHAGFHRYQRAK